MEHAFASPALGGSEKIIKLMAYYRNWKRRNSYRARHSPATPASQSERIRAATVAKANAFVFNKFRGLIPAEFEAYSRWYERENGKSAYDYLCKTYPDWKSGAVSMSAQTRKRILAGIPRVMTRSEQFQLLGFYAPHLLNVHRESTRNKTVNSADFVKLYDSCVQSILGQFHNIDWFVTAVFSQAELNAFQNVIRFILLKNLEESFYSVKSDLFAIVRCVHRLDAEVTLSYRVGFLGATVLASKLESLEHASLRVKLPDLSHEDASQPELAAIMAECRLNESMKSDFGSAMQFLAIQDLSAAVLQMSTRLDAEWNADITVEGKGGTATLRILKRSVEKLKAQMAITFGWMIVAVISVITVATLTFKSRRPNPIFAIVGGVFGLAWLNSLWNTLKTHKETIENYERRKSKILAED